MSTVLERIQYGFDRDSRRVWRRRVLTTGEDYHYDYDGLSQVVKSDRGTLNLNCSAIAATPEHAESWDYDPTGNWHGYKVERDGSVTLDQDRHHDKGNRLTQIDGEANPFLLDRVGRMTQAAPDASGDWDEPLKFKWDAWSRITEIRRASDDSVLAKYSYDGLSRRTTREVAGVVHHTYYSDQWKPLEERKDTEATASMQYLWGARHRDDLLRRDRDSDGGGTLDETRYVLMDYFSPAAITDEEGEVTERYDFSAFGLRRIMEPNFSARVASECDFEFAFQGQFLDTQIGLLDYGYRYYSPNLGRWMCKDPLGFPYLLPQIVEIPIRAELLRNVKRSNGLLYWYVRNDALNTIDFLGLADCDDDDCDQSKADGMAASESARAQAETRCTMVEFCGAVCCIKGELSMLGPLQGGPGYCATGLLTSQCEGAGGKAMATWHTHPNDDRQIMPDSFSGDKQFADEWKCKSFMTNAKGETTVYDPATGKETLYPIESPQ